MTKEFVVVDHEGFVSCAKGGEPEKFSTFKSARQRSCKLAAHTPGFTIRIYELTAETVMPVGRVETSRTQPREHYDE